MGLFRELKSSTIWILLVSFFRFYLQFIQKHKSLIPFWNQGFTLNFFFLEIFLVICLGFEPRTPSLKGMCSTC